MNITRRGALLEESSIHTANAVHQIQKKPPILDQIYDILTELKTQDI